MRDWIQGDAPSPLGGVITKSLGHHGVTHFVDRQGENQGDDQQCEYGVFASPKQLQHTYLRWLGWW